MSFEAYDKLIDTALSELNNAAEKDPDDPLFKAVRALLAAEKKHDEEVREILELFGGQINDINTRLNQL
jgi:hypothetical protein